MNDTIIDNPLLPEHALEYFQDASILPKRYLRAVSMRYCLEAIVDTVFIHIAKEQGVTGQWEKKRLVDKIDSLKDFFPPETLGAVHDIRKITNKGAHQSGHKELDEADLVVASTNLNKICEWVLISYIKKYGFHTQAWTPTVLSTLQPVYRIRMLEELYSYYLAEIEDKESLISYLESVQEFTRRLFFGEPLNQTDRSSENRKFEQILLVIDKLAMAYMKNNQYEKGVRFIHECFESRTVNGQFKDEMIKKLEMLQAKFSELPIAQDIEQTREKLKKILPCIREKDRSLFVIVFMAIVTQDELMKLSMT